MPMTNLYSTEGKILGCVYIDRRGWFVKCCTFTTAYLVIFSTTHCFRPQVILYNDQDSYKTDLITCFCVGTPSYIT